MLDPRELRSFQFAGMAEFATSCIIIEKLMAFSKLSALILNTV